MTLNGDYFKDDEIVMVWYEKSKDAFHISLEHGEGLIVYRTTPEERLAFTAEIDRRMAYGKSR